MIQTVNSIDKVIWEANKKGRNSISLPPFDEVSDEVINTLRANGFICKKQTTISENVYWLIGW